MAAVKEDEGNGLRDSGGEHPAGDAGQLAFLGIFLVCWVLDSFFLHWTTFAAEYLSAPARIATAAVVMVCGFLLARAAHPVADHGAGPAAVRTTGVYRYVRHPLYLGALLFYAAFTLATCSLVSLGLLVVIFLFYDYIAGYEEKLMLNSFGGEYEAYMKKTGKWIPRPGWN